MFALPLHLLSSRQKIFVEGSKQNRIEVICEILIGGSSWSCLDSR